MSGQELSQEEEGVTEVAPCPHCGEPHPMWSPAWRGCQDRQAEVLLEHPEKWVFNVLPFQDTTVVRAHQLAVETLEGKLVELSHVQSMLPVALTENYGEETDKKARNDIVDRFMSAFHDDMPEVLARRAHDPSAPVAFLWHQAKIEQILNQHDLKFVDFDTEVVDLDLRLRRPATEAELAQRIRVVEISSAGLRAAADRVDHLVADGYQLHDLIMDGGDKRALFYLRRVKAS